MDAPRANSRVNSMGLESLPTSVAEQLKLLKEEVQWNRGRINAIEETIQTLEQPLRRTYSTQQDRDHDHRDPTTLTTVTDDDEMEQRYMCLDAKDTIPEVRECNFTEFKNRFDPDGKDGCYAVDVLVSGKLLHQEIQQEYKLRDRMLDGGTPTPYAPVIKNLNKNKAISKAVKSANKNTMLMKDAQAEKWPRRIRIQSPAILRIFARIQNEKWTDKPRTYYRPFPSLIYHYPHFKRALRKLERKFAPDSTDADSGPDEDDGPGTPGWYHNDDTHDEVQNSPAALACLRAYVEYMEHNVMPDYHRYENLNVSSNATVYFSDLWNLFRTGELVYEEPAGGLPDRRDFRTGKKIWMTYYIYSVPARTMGDDVDARDAAIINDDTSFSVGCYHIDWTGEEFCVVKKTIKIEHFSGDIPVTELPVYPMRFRRDWKDRLDSSVKTGDLLLECLREKHCSYNGWTLTRAADGGSTTDAHGAQLQQPEHINSEVMVDFGEAFQACPSWRPEPATLERWQIEGLCVPDDFRVRWWSGPDRASLLGETTELIPVKTGVTAKQRNTYLQNDPFLVAVAENTKRLKPTTENDLTPDCKALLTGRVYAYVFQERKFAQLAVSKLRLAPKTGLALDSLKIPPSVKDAIQGSIQGHFLQKNAERRIDQNFGSLDLIQGKGTGLFILLHGVPGVGKTATAEAIAQANGKPLFKITAGDLGMTPEKLEMSLRDIFRLASIWDCILLLDEVDTFFSQRSRADTATNKNALVSVFLRVLDYYNGVLFLTTNRAGVLDEAFISRIHTKVLYKDLTLPQTLDIWKLNIQRVRQIDAQLSKVENRPLLQINEQELLEFAAYLFNEGSHPGHHHRVSGRWNGRQIRNAFQVARSLAYYEHSCRKNTDDALPPTLDVRHFRTMHDITASFEHYRNSIRGGTDAELALEQEARNDRFQDHLTRSWQDEYHEEHQREAAAAAGGSVAVTTTVAVGGRGPPQRPPVQQHGAEDASLLPNSPGQGDNLSPSQHHHQMFSSQQPGDVTRNRSGSYLSTQVLPHPGHTGVFESQQQQQPYHRLGHPSPRHSPQVIRDGLEGTQPAGRGFPSPPGNGSYGYSEHLYGGGAPSGTPYTPRNVNPMIMRGPSPGVAMVDNGGGMAQGAAAGGGGGGEYGQGEYFSPSLGGNGGFSGTGMQGRQAAGRHGSGGWSAGAGGGRGAGGYGGGQYNSGQGRGENMDTDLSLDN